MANTLVTPLILSRLVLAVAVQHQYAVPKDQRKYRITIPNVSLMLMGQIVDQHILPKILKLRAQDGTWGVAPNAENLFGGLDLSTISFGGRDWAALVHFDNMKDEFGIVLYTPNRW